MDGGGEDGRLLSSAERAAEETVKVWIHRTLRETFFQGLRQAWTLTTSPPNEKSASSPSSSDLSSNASPRHDNDGENVGLEPCYRVEVNMSDVNLSLSLVDRVARAWQSKLRQDQHEEVARWVQEVFWQGKSKFWSSWEPMSSEDDTQTNRVLSFRQDPPLQQLDEDGTSDSFQVQDGTLEEEGQTGSIGEGNKIPYCELRALGRRTSVGAPPLPVPDALKRVQEYTRNNKTYWPLDTRIIDQTAAYITRRMSEKDRHGVGDKGITSSSTRGVRFQVLPKPSREEGGGGRDPEGENGNGGENDEARTPAFFNQQSMEEFVLKKKRKFNNKKAENISTSQPSQNRRQRTENEETPRPPWDPDSIHSITLSRAEMEQLDASAIVPNEQDNSTESSLGLFGGLEKVGLVNHKLQTPEASVTEEISDRVLRRKQNASIQERLDPHRLQQRGENPQKIKSKVFKTENFFDDTLKYFDLDLGWCLLEVRSGNNRKRLCAFSSMEISLDDREEPPASAGTDGDRGDESSAES